MRENQNKKAQEESMGFVIIIMILVVVGVVFLSFMLKSPKTSDLKQQELADLTWAILSHTTNCTVYSRTTDTWALAKICDKNLAAKCDDLGDEPGQKVCDYLKNDLENLLEKLLGNNASLSNKEIHAYQFILEMSRDEIIIAKGNQSGEYARYITFIPGSNGEINVSAKFYF